MAAQFVPTEIIQRLGLESEEAHDAVEYGICAALSRLYRGKFLVAWNGNGRVDAVALRSDGVMAPVDWDKLSRKARRVVIHFVETELTRRQALKDAKRLKHAQNSLVVGEVLQSCADSVLVEVTLGKGWSEEKVVGVLPLREQPCHERGLYFRGKTMRFMVISLRPVEGETGICALRTVLSRRSKKLPALHLRELTDIPDIVCTERIPGAYSNIITPKRLPKDTIVQVVREYKERLNVRIEDRRRG